MTGYKFFCISITYNSKAKQLKIKSNLSEGDPRLILVTRTPPSTSPNHSGFLRFNSSTISGESVIIVMPCCVEKVRKILMRYTHKNM